MTDAPSEARLDAFAMRWKSVRCVGSTERLRYQWFMYTPHTWVLLKKWCRQLKRVWHFSRQASRKPELRGG